ncbi:IS481 family transposase, partial [Klebsiella variicola]
SLELMTPVDYILRESKNCNMWWTHTAARHISLISIWYMRRAYTATPARST